MFHPRDRTGGQKRYNRRGATPLGVGPFTPSLIGQGGHRIENSISSPTYPGTSLLLPSPSLSQSQSQSPSPSPSPLPSPSFLGNVNFNASQQQQVPATRTTTSQIKFDTNVPNHTIGFHQLYPPNERAGSDAQVDIIAIHGLAEDAYSTWTEPTSGKLWLRDFLPQFLFDRHGIRCRVMTFGYQSGVFTQDAYENNGRLHTFSEQLLNHLADSDRKSPDGSYRPILFVCHSLGGLVIKAALNLAFSKSYQYPGIVDSTKSIIFLGTPHAGANLMVWARLLGRLSFGLRLNSRSSEDFRTWSGTLMDLATNFVDRAPKLKITTFFETHGLRGQIIVDEGSARMNLQNERTVPLDGDHLSICKFATMHENTAVTVLKRITRTVEEIVKEAAEEKALREAAEQEALRRQK